MNLRALVERKIRDAAEQGTFRDLEGEGKPQQLEDNPFEDPERRIAHKMLANAGFVPAWVELINEIEAEAAASARAWEDYRAHRARQMAAIHRGSVVRFAELIAEFDAGRDRALARQEERWRATNKKIAHLNGIAPTDSVMRVPIQIQERRRRFERDFPRLGGIVGG